MIYSVLQESLKKVQYWLSNRKIRLNELKYTPLPFQPMPTIELNKQPIPQVGSAKYLEMHVGRLLRLSREHTFPQKRCH